MSTWKNKVESLLFKSKSKGAMSIVAFMLASIMLLIPMAVLAQDGVSDLTYTEVWDKRGTDSLNCDLEGEGPRTEDGWIHWVFNTKGDSTKAELVLGGSGNGTTYSPGAPLQDNIWHFYTPYYDIETLTATIYLYDYEGEEGSGGGLVIFDYCPGPEGEDEDEIETVGGESEVETPEQVVVAQETPQTTPDDTITVTVEPEEPQTDPAQDTETDSEEPAVDPDHSGEVTVDPNEPQSVPDTSGTVLPIISLGVLLLSSGGVMLRKYKDQ